MAGSKSDYLEDKLINHVLRNVAFTSPTTVYLGLFTTDPGEAAGGAEVAGGAYARQSIAFDAPSPAGQTQNTSEVTYPVATANWGTIGFWVVFDAVSAGNRLYHGDFTTAKAINTDDTAKVNAGDVQVDED